MLVDVAAILSTSSALGTVDEAFSVPETFRVTISAPSSMTTEQLSWLYALDGERGAMPLSTPTAGIPAADPDPDVAPQPGAVNIEAARVPLAKLSSLHGVELLDQLALLSRSQLSGFVSGHPASVDALLASPPAAGEVAAFWTQTTPAQHENLLSAAPGLVGGLEGFPYSVRDQANRTNLSNAEKAIRHRLAAGVGRAEADQLTKRL
ncbi:MAG: hypothetical protein ABUL47_01165, partial [Leifsonia sp.]